MDEQKKKVTNKEKIKENLAKPNSIESLKQTLHKMIDEITAADYVDFNYGLPDATNQNMKPLIRIIIEKNGNIFVGPKGHPGFKFDEEEF